MAMIARDRSGIYGEGASRGAPMTVQMAHRWHLIRYPMGAVERAILGKFALLREAAAASLASPPREGPLQTTLRPPTRA
jgi:hypothetical protein